MNVVSQEKTFDSGPKDGQGVATRLRVLVVDDSKLQRRIVVANLNRWGFSVLEAETGLEALEICETQPVDLIVSDWMMPGMNGLEFCQAFRRLDRERYGYFILLTSKSEKNDVAIGLDVGADDFLSKPVDAAELKARIRAGTRVLDMENRLLDQNETVQGALDELQQVYDGIAKDLAEAERFQQSLVPVRHRRLDGGEVSLLFQPAGHVGGDLVGFFSFAPDRLGLYSIDVSGHGISSALLTARLAGYLSPHSQGQNVAFAQGNDGVFSPRDPATMARILNNRMCDEMDTEHYFTLAYADVDLQSGEVRMVQAGHPHPCLVQRDASVTCLGAGGPPIGLLPQAEFETVTFSLRPGDRLFLHSDGLTECQDPDDRLLDEDGLAGILRAIDQDSGPEFLSDLMWEVARFTRKRPFDDDVSGILFDYRPAAGTRQAAPDAQAAQAEQGQPATGRVG